MQRHGTLAMCHIVHIFLAFDYLVLAGGKQTCWDFLGCKPVMFLFGSKCACNGTLLCAVDLRDSFVTADAAYNSELPAYIANCFWLGVYILYTY